jgi:hypothetical protein
MDGPREIESGGDRQIVKPHVLAPTLIDLERDQAGAIPVGRSAIVSHGQPCAQLQYSTYRPSICQLLPATGASVV